MELKVKVHHYTFKPTSYDADEVRAIMGVKRGTWVLGVDLRVGEAYDAAATISIGDGDGDASFMTTVQADIENAELKHGYGLYFSASNGKLYTEDDTIDITYTHHDDVTEGLVTAIVTYAEVE